MKYIVFAIFLLSTIVSSWDLVWSDEFKGNSVDESSWNFEITSTPQNNELEAYIRNNAMLNDGVLIIQARKQSYSGKAYTSSRINTAGKRDFHYGKFEARLKMPVGKGLWPAFWMMPYQGSPWPASGEIDIMETIGTSSNAYGTLHYGSSWSTHQWKSAAYNVQGGYQTDFHVYQCIWQENSISFAVDGEIYASHSPSDVQPWPFNDHSFYIILNFAVGGDWPGAPDAQTAFPSDFVVDYVRVYQGSASPPAGTGIVLQNTDISGNDLKSVKRMEWSDCFGPCYYTDGCQSFSWSNYEGGTCWLKTTKDKSTAVGANGVYASYMCSLAENKDISGNDLESIISNDPKHCCAFCARNSNCRAFSWNNANGGTCYLKSGGALVDRTGVWAWSMDSQGFLSY